MSFKDRWQDRVWPRLVEKGLHFGAAPLGWSFSKRLQEIIPREMKGLLLDAGAGSLSLAPLVDRTKARYLAMDVAPTHGDLDFVGSLEALSIRSGSLDAVLCSQVLEHLRRPWLAVDEIVRVLKPGGKALVTAPHISYLHGEPEDYYRYTPHGLRALLEGAGLDVIWVEKAGGLLSLLLSFPSMVVLTIFYPIPLLGPLVARLNALIVRAGVWIDARIGMVGSCPLHVLALAQKKGPPEGGP